MKTPGSRKKPNVAPVAAVSILTVTTVDDPVTVSTSGTVDADGHLSSGSLNWGDGTVITWTGVPATSYAHTYAGAATYTITLTVIDNKFAQDSASCTVTLTLPDTGDPVPEPGTSPPVPPTAVLSYVSGQFRGFPYVLGTTGTIQGSTPLSTGSLGWGDGTATVTWTGAPASTLSHTYANAGTYTATLTVTDTGGLSAVATRILTVESQVAANQTPTAKITKTSQTFGSLVVSTAGTFDPENALASGSITWGDGQTTTWTGAPAASYSHTYTATATYAVTLTVRDMGGLSNASSINVVISVQAPPSSAYTTSKTLLSSSDFTFLGVLRPPDESGAQPKGLTWRRVAGQFRLLSYATNGEVHEWVPGTPSMSQVYGDIPFATLGRNYGVPWGTYNGFVYQSNTLTTTNDMQLSGIHWDETDGRLYFTSVTYYNNDSSHTCVNIGYATQGVDINHWTPAGMWYTDEPSSAGGFGGRWSTGMTAIPSDFANAVLGGKRLGIGFGGGYWQGIFSNNISQGPTLFAIDPLDGATAYQAKIAQSLKPLLFHPYSGVKISSPRIGRRPSYATANNKFGNPTNPFPDDPWIPDADGTSYYANSDQNHAGVWIDGSTKHGFLSFATLAQGSAQTTVRSVSFVATVNGYRFYDLTVDSTTGFEPNMYLHLEDPTGTHYGGWLVGVSHNSNTGPYATNVAEGNTNNPIISSTVIRVYDVEQTASWTPVNAIGLRLTAGQWYGGGGYKSATHRTHWLVYDPRDLATQAANLTGPWSELDFRDAWAVNYDRRRESYVSPGAVPGATAAVFDDVANKLYVVVQGADLGLSYNQYLPLVYVYSVNA